MRIEAASIDDCFDKIPEDRKEPMKKLWQIILDHILNGFEAQLSYGMPGFVVPHSRFPQGYHCNPKLPLPFLSIASQKSFIGFYHMGLYADKNLEKWFVQEYPNHAKQKLDMGKSCIRFKKVDDIPYELIGELVSKMSVDDWINLYQQQSTHQKGTSRKRKRSK